MRSLFPLVLCVAWACAPADDVDAADTDAGVASEEPSDTDVVSVDTQVFADSFIEGRDCPPDSPLTWGNFGESVVLTHCTGCHSDNLAEGVARGRAPVGVDFNTHDMTRSWLERIYARSADEHVTMPPVDTLSQTVRVQLGDWLACGAP
jgi:hypothetical protein